MNPELTKRLVDSYPSLMAGVAKSPRESLMSFGFECDDGWFRILDELFYYMHRKNQQTLWVKTTDPDIGFVKVPAPQIELAQVKEKFGGLRVYTNTDTSGCTYSVEGGPDILAKDYLDKQIEHHLSEVHGGILMAEYTASRTCEVSGEPGKLCNRGGWFKTLSPRAAQKYGYTHPDTKEDLKLTPKDETSVDRDNQENHPAQ